MGSALSVAVGPSFSTHIAVGRTMSAAMRCDRRVGIGADDEVLRIAVAGIGLVACVRRRLEVVVAHDPVGIELAVLQHPVLLDGVEADLAWQQPCREFPELLRMLAVLGIGHQHVCG